MSWIRSALSARYDLHRKTKTYCPPLVQPQLRHAIALVNNNPGCKRSFELRSALKSPSHNADEDEVVHSLAAGVDLGDDVSSREKGR
jgi:hypothetical protein